VPHDTLNVFDRPLLLCEGCDRSADDLDPPLRLLLGSDAYAAVEKNDLARLEEARTWKELSVSTDFETE
jgi:hypothetical protein